MKVIGLVGISLAVALATAGRAEAQASDESSRRVVQAQLDTVTSVWVQRGYSRDASLFGGQPVVGALKNAASVQIELVLRAGAQYMIGAGCDTDCSDLDLSLSAAGATTALASDVAEDDVPVLAFTAPSSGRYFLTISMAACSSDPCYFGFVVATK